MKVLRFLLLLLGLSMQCTAQDSTIRVLLSQLPQLKSDTSAVKVLLELGNRYQDINPDSGFIFENRALILSKKIGDTAGEISSRWALQNFFWSVGDFPTAIKLALELKEHYTVNNDRYSFPLMYSVLLTTYRDAGDYPEALKYAFLGINFPEGNEYALSMEYAMAGSVYYEMGNIDSAAYFMRKALEHPLNLGPGWTLMMNGRVYARRDSLDMALHFYRRAADSLKKENNLKDLAQDYNSIGALFLKRNFPDSAIHYGKLSLEITQPRRLRREIIQSFQLLSDAYLNKDIAISYQYFRLASKTKDSVYSQASQRAAISQRFNEQLRQTELENVNQRNISRNHQFILLLVMSLALIASVFLFRNNRRKQQVNKLLNKKNEQIESAMSELKAAQAQLIQSEKMASLGEVTAGIAHEIQNPLNFVNNFSELNRELMGELKSEASSLPALSGLVADLESNNEKILHHGRRAEAIVKGMLAHSRKVSEEKRPVALNDLCEEALMTSYKAEKIRNPDLEIILNRSYADEVANVKVVEADLSRALVNLFSNAFYEVIRKARESASVASEYKPTVSIRTQINGNNAEIRISDNGAGIPEEIREKIFQPFFTSKPTGVGTGLGLTLVYETITKVHKGVVRVEASGGAGTTFLLSIPKGEA